MSLLRVNGFLLALFGRHVARRADYKIRARERGAAVYVFLNLSHAEICHLDPVAALVLGYHYVVGFDIAVDHACRVSGFERAADLAKDPRSAFDC